MSFNSYLVRKFEYSHENLYFRKFSAALNAAFGENTGEHVLIGNISCNGHQIDAIFIARGQITVIDFKDYSGELTFSENNPWRMKTPEGEIVFVQGGAQSRNPFQQVRAYRFSLAELLEDNESKILDGTRTNIKWIHTGCVVQFQRSVKYELSSIPSGVSRYFHITDDSSAVNLLRDLYSTGLELSDNEIRAVLSVLDVSEENLLESHSFEEDVELDPRAGASKLALIKRLISGHREDSEFERILNYYKTLINVEKFKEPSASQLHAFPFHQDLPINEYPINIAASEEFHQVFLTNMQERFPKNLFVGIDILIDGQNVPILHRIILAADIQDQNEIIVDFDEFDIYGSSLETMGLAEDAIEELTTEVNDAKTLGEKLTCIREYLNVSAEMTSRILLGLSTESLFSAQLLSELGKIIKLPSEFYENPVFKSFLTNKSISDQDRNSLVLDPFIRITDLNESQTNAVKLSFRQPLTVVTGPPGTGKSQVVLNIIANAIVNGYSVLFASKNNKAVDNVKERFEGIVEESYLLRFGSKDEIENTAKPLLGKYVSKHTQGLLADKEPEMEFYTNEVKARFDKLEFLNNQLQQIPLLRNTISGLIENLAIGKGKHEEWLLILNPLHRMLFIDMRQTVNIDISEIGLLIQRITQWDKHFLSKLFFNWFSKPKFEGTLRIINTSLSNEIKNHVAENAPWASGSDSILLSGRRNLDFILSLKKAEQETNHINNDFILKTTAVEKDIEINTNKLKSLEAVREDYESEIITINKEIPSICSKYLKIIIHQKLLKQNIANTERYKDYLPANNIWKDEEVADFSDTASTFLQDYNSICLTSLSIKNSFPLKSEIADILVIDEASQCDIASAIPMILRAKKLVVIGDPLQLRHITSVQQYEQEYVTDMLDLETLQLDYVNKSLYDYCFRLSTTSRLESVFLQEHYRCHPEIIKFSNQYFYERRLGQSMLIHTNPEQFNYGEKGINWVHVNGEMHRTKNINTAEINRTVELAKQLAAENPTASIGIVTPFRDQNKELFSSLQKELSNNVKVDTVHK